MAVGRDPSGKTWHFIVDLPSGTDGNGVKCAAVVSLQRR
jgi:hypothetical protein